MALRLQSNARAAETPAFATGHWLPAGKRAAICFSIDDIHPAKSTDAYEAGGDLAAGALGHLLWLSERHPALKTTLFVTPDWRQKSPIPTRKIVSAVPLLRDHLYLAERWPAGTMRLDRHQEFVAFLNDLPNVECALHGLHHCAPGPRIPLEFLGASYNACLQSLREAMHIGRAAKLRFVPGLAPPGWHAPPELLRAMSDLRLQFVASSRDIRTDIARHAVGRMSGLQGLPLIDPCILSDYGIVQIPTNFQATSEYGRAERIVELGGLLSIKAHVVKDACGHIALDGLDGTYMRHLDDVLSRLEDKHAESLLFSTMSEIARLALDAPMP